MDSQLKEAKRRYLILRPQTGCYLQSTDRFGVVWTENDDDALLWSHSERARVEMTAEYQRRKLDDFFNKALPRLVFE